MSITDYLDNLNKNNLFYDFYNEILSFENIHFIPAVRFETALFLYNTTFLNKPLTILEIGFGSGVSSFFINKGLIDSKIMPNSFISLERDNNRFNRGKRLIEKYNYKNIELLNIDAFYFLSQCKNGFDFIFLDAVKREYIQYLEKLKTILNKNGILICDNILFNGKIVEENISPKYKNGVTLLKEFNDTICKDKELNTFFYNIGDGLSLSIKID